MPSTLSQRGAHVVEPRWRLTLLAQGVGGWARQCRIGHHVRIVDWPLTEGCAAFHAVITGSTSDHCSLDRSVL